MDAPLGRILWDIGSDDVDRVDDLPFINLSFPYNHFIIQIQQHWSDGDKLLEKEVKIEGWVRELDVLREITNLYNPTQRLLFTGLLEQPSRGDIPVFRVTYHTPEYLRSLYDDHPVVWEIDKYIP